MLAATITDSTPRGIYYRIEPLHPGSHTFGVRMEIAAPDPAGQVLSLPAWIPGSYLIRDFARNIVGISASSDGSPIVLDKLDKSRWQAAPVQSSLLVEYEVYAWDLSVRGAYLDQERGYFNGSCVFLCAERQESQECEVEISLPDSDYCQHWEVATTLPVRDAKPWATGLYFAASYDELIDHPVEMARFTRAQFEACGVAHDIVISGRHDADMDRLCRDLKPICEQHIRMFGEPAPFDRYLFMTMAVGDGYGGLEHRNSTSLISPRNGLPRKSDNGVDDGYRDYLGLCSHEYFHCWNVKRIQPAAFQPFDLSQEVHTRLLWAFEGITSYYDDLGVCRSGLIDTDSYLELLGKTITRVLRGSGRLKQSVAESSFDAWTRFYKQDENAPNAIVSYYAKGSLVALALDLTLRRKTEHRVSLDDLMRELWRRNGQTGQGVEEFGIEKLASELCGEDLSGFFAQTVDGREDFPLEGLLCDVGIQYKLRPAASSQDVGGKPADKAGADIGARWKPDSGGVRITHVLDGGTAMRSGIAAGDLLIAVNDLRVESADFDKQLSRLPMSASADIHLFRRDELMQLTVNLSQPIADTCYLVVDENATEQVKKRRENWLGSQ